MFKYEIWQRELDEHRSAVEHGEPFEVNVRDEAKSWKRVQAVVSSSPIEGGDPAALLVDRGTIIDKGKWYVRIIRELPEDDYVFTISHPGSS